MQLKGIVANTAMLCALLTVPAIALGQSNREKSKNGWRDLAVGSGVVGLLGLVAHDGTLTFLGTTGALYSAYRYEEDRKSQSREARARYRLFRRGSFVRNGHRYKRRIVYRNGQKYYQFVRIS